MSKIYPAGFQCFIILLIYISTKILICHHYIDKVIILFGAQSRRKAESRGFSENMQMAIIHIEYGYNDRRMAADSLGMLSNWGSLDRITTGSSIQDILEDLLDVQPFDEVMDDLKNEIWGWQSWFAGCDLTSSWNMYVHLTVPNQVPTSV